MTESGNPQHATDEGDWFEESPHEQRIAHYHDQGDFDGLIDYLEAELRSTPRSRVLEQEIIEALAERGDVERARALLAPLHRRDPEDLWVQRAILDVLIAEGLPWKAFEWRVEPKVRELDDDLLSVCADLARAEGGTVGLDELFDRLPPDFDAFAFFSVDQLAQALVRDGRFVLCLEDAPLVFLTEHTSPNRNREQQNA